jgi:hypothetical protein
VLSGALGPAPSPAMLGSFLSTKLYDGLRIFIHGVDVVKNIFWIFAGFS